MLTASSEQEAPKSSEWYWHFSETKGIIGVELYKEHKPLKVGMY